MTSTATQSSEDDPLGALDSFAIIDALPGHVAILDRDGRILAASSSWRDFAAISGIAAPAPTGASYFELCATASWGDQAQAIVDGQAAILAGRQTQLSIVHPSDHGAFRRWYRLMAAPIALGGTRGVLVMHLDITSSKLAEDALRQSQKMEAVGQLTGGIAHDFNNMLTVIAGNLELLESKLTDKPKLLRLVNAAAVAAGRAEKLTQQLLTFSRRQQLQPQAIDLNQVIIGMGDLLHRTVGEHIDIRTQLAAELWPALADPNQIETALLNLILNARDAMPNGGNITIETGNVAFERSQGDISAGAYATLAVTDTGQGMSEEVAARAFEPFFTTKEMGRGSGLGLAQVYGFAKQSAGHARIDSRVGHGTTVQLYLPRA
jgi:signal transduction histidine kinase